MEINDLAVKKKNLIFFDKLAGVFLTIGLFLAPLMFWPMFGLSLDATKKIILSLTIILALVFWFIARLQQRKISIPKTAVLSLSVIFLILAVLSAIFSGAIRMSLVGMGFELGTVLSFVTLLGLLFLASEYFRSEGKFLNFYIGLFAVMAIVFIFQALRLAFGNFLPWGTYDYAVANLIGKWNELGVFAGLIVTATAIMLEFFPLKQTPVLKIFTWLVLAASIITIILVNFSLIWIVLAVVMFLVYLYSLAVNVNKKTGWTRYFRLSLVLFIVSLAFIAFAQPLSYDSTGQAYEGFLATGIRVVSTKLEISSLEVRPSLQGTFNVFQADWKNKLMLGVGPNQFVSTWLLNKPAGVNNSVFWNLEPDFGFGFVPTLFVTTGLWGGLVFVLFVLLVLWAGIKALFNKEHNSLDKTILLLALASVLYLWIFSFIYSLGVVVLSLVFVLTGLLIARLIELGDVKNIELSLDATDSARTKYLYYLVSSVVGVLIILVVYSTITCFVATISYSATLNAKDLSSAEVSLNRALKLNPIDLYYRLASQIDIAQLNSLVSQEMSKDKLLEAYQARFLMARSHAESAIATNERNYQNYLALGNLFASAMQQKITGAYAEAKNNYLKALTYNPHGPDIYLILARLEIDNDNLSEADKYLAKSLEEKKDYVDAIYIQSQLYAQRGFMDTAIRRSEDAANLAPNDPGVLFQLGYLKYRNGDYNGAVKAFNASLTVSPQFIDAMYFLGLSLDKLGKTNSALEVFSTLAKTGQTSYDVDKVIANIKAGRGALVNEAPKQEKAE